VHVLHETHPRVRPLVKAGANIFKVLALSGMIAVLGLVGWRMATQNEGAVLPGELYRSGQLDAPELSTMIGAHGIRTVVNLRGKNPQSEWYIQEVALCRKLGVQHVDVRWSAQHLPPPAEVIKLLDAYRDMPRPILLHCRSGSDRTGLASALYLIDQKHISWQNARQALSWQYGHFAIYPYFEMDEFVHLYGQSGRASLAEWVAKDYPSTYAAEQKETRWDEMTEPFDWMIKGSE
jgi:protein tyrosine phosphatase (PTP) superfamily phosphohydrolase (DUF442 family)